MQCKRCLLGPVHPWRCHNCGQYSEAAIVANMLVTGAIIVIGAIGVMYGLCGWLVRL